MIEAIKKKYNEKMCKEFEVIRDTLILLRESDNISLEDCAADILTDVHKSFKSLIDSDDMVEVIKKDSLQDKVTDTIRQVLDNHFVIRINLFNKEIQKLS